MTHTILQTKSSLYNYDSTIRETISITTPDGVYVIDKKFVDEVRAMSRSRFSLARNKVRLTDEMLIAMAIEENMVIERRDL